MVVRVYFNLVNSQFKIPDHISLRQYICHASSTKDPVASRRCEFVCALATGKIIPGAIEESAHEVIRTGTPKKDVFVRRQGWKSGEIASIELIRAVAAPEL